MRGVGWAICYQNPANGRLSNHWITLHETGNVAGFTPILVMDVWEHAYLLDYKPAERPKYIEAFFSNIAWDTVEERLKKITGVQSARQAWNHGFSVHWAIPRAQFCGSGGFFRPQSTISERRKFRIFTLLGQDLLRLKVLLVEVLVRLATREHDINRLFKRLRAPS